MYAQLENTQLIKVILFHDITMDFKLELKKKGKGFTTESLFRINEKIIDFYEVEDTYVDILTDQANYVIDKYST